MRLDFTKTTLGIDQLLPKITNPLHRAILLNYRRHAMLEVSARYEEIFGPGMMVEVPKYHMHGGVVPGNYAEFTGVEEIKAVYKSLADQNITQMFVSDEHIAVADWGFASESVFLSFKPGRSVSPDATGAIIDDPDAIYLESRVHTMIWHYDERARLKGEHVYGANSATVRKCEPHEIWTAQEVRDALAPLINELAVL